MNGVDEGELVTPRAKALTLELASDPAFRYRVERGDALRLAGRRPDGQVEVDYLQHRWVTSEDALQPLAALSGGEPGRRPGELPATGEQSVAVTPPSSGSRQRLMLAAAVLVVAVALVLLLVQRMSVDEQPLARDRSTPAPATGAASTPAAAPVVPATSAVPTSATAGVTAVPAPAVSNLVVCDSTVDCGIAAGQFSRVEFLACLRVTPSGNAPLMLVATAGDDPPAGAESASVLARSGPVPQDPAFRCHAVRTDGAELANGRYILWALVGTTVLGRVPFVVGPP